MEGIYSTSIVLEGGDAVKAEPYALFCAEDRNGCHLEVGGWVGGWYGWFTRTDGRLRPHDNQLHTWQVYPRPDGSVYICGLGGSDYVSGGRLAPGGDCDRPEKIVPNPKCVGVRDWTGLNSGGAPVLDSCRLRASICRLSSSSSLPQARGGRHAVLQRHEPEPGGENARHQLLHAALCARRPPDNGACANGNECLRGCGPQLLGHSGRGEWRRKGLCVGGSEKVETSIA